MEYKVLKNVVGNELLYGNTVYFTESGESVPYILVSGGNGKNYLFMREYALPDKVAFFAEASAIGTTDSERIYENHTLDKYLSTTFFNRFEASWQRVFAQQYASVTRASDGLQYGINRKVFAPAATELGIKDDGGGGTVPTEGATVWAYFKTNAASKRRCRLGSSNGSYVDWWTRSKNNHEGNFVNYYAIKIEEDGSYRTDAWQKNSYYVRPVISINENVSIAKDGSSWRVIPNLPPVLPSQSLSRLTVTSGNSFELSWDAATDEDGPASVQYRLQARKDGGEWETVLETDETSCTKSLAYKEALDKVEFRVQAFDSYNNASDYVRIAEIEVINNVPPSAPSYIVSVGTYMNEQISVSWGNATDEDGNLSGYKLYRSVDDGDYTLVSSTSSNVFRETAGEWTTVKYKVYAFDSYGALSSDCKETTLTLRKRVTMNVFNNPEEENDIEDWGCYEVYAGEEETGKRLRLVLEDTAEEESYIADIVLDNEILLESRTGVTVGEIIFNISKETWQSILNGEHEIDYTVRNAAGDTFEDYVYFEKYTYGAEIGLKSPVTIDSEEPVTKFLLNIKGDLSEDVSLTVKVTNNANDTEPVWQSVPLESVNTNKFVAFDNTTVKNGNAFNFIVTAEGVGDGSYISSISGMFGQNLFELIFARLDALEGG